MDAAIESDLPPAARTLIVVRPDRRLDPGAAARQPPRGNLRGTDGDPARWRAVRRHPRRRHGPRRFARFARRLRVADRVCAAGRAPHSDSRGMGFSGGPQPACRREIGAGARALQCCSHGGHAGFARNRIRLVRRSHRQPTPRRNSARWPRRNTCRPPSCTSSPRPSAYATPWRRWRGMTRRASAACCSIRMPACAIACRSVVLRWTAWWMLRWPPAHWARASPAPVSAAARWSSAAAPTSPKSAMGWSTASIPDAPITFFHAEPGRGAVHS